MRAQAEAERQREPILDAHERDEPLEERDAAEGQRPPGEHAPVDEPAREAEQVHEARPPRIEARAAQQVRQRLGRVAAMVAERDVERPVGGRARRHIDEKTAARPQQLGQARHERSIVRDVLDDVDGDDGVVGPPRHARRRR